MSEINEILGELHEVSGVKGTAVLTTDGMTVASTLGEEFLSDVVAGLSSFLVSTTRRTLVDAGLGEQFTRFVMNATHGKVILLDLGEAFLVVITNQFTHLQNCLAEVQEAASKIRRVARIQM